jgi:hypothetical protein
VRRPPCRHRGQDPTIRDGARTTTAASWAAFVTAIRLGGWDSNPQRLG